ncbi:MAG: hypothetical protein ACJASR_002242, partial [Psychroserpens sp.]
MDMVNVCYIQSLAHIKTKMRKLFTLLILTIFFNTSYGQNEKDIIIGK